MDVENHKKPITFEERWPVLQVAVDKLINLVEGVDEQGFTSEKYMRYYTTVYEMCIVRESLGNNNSLYNQYKKVFEEYVTSKVLPSLRGKKDGILLQELLRRWSNHKTMTSWLSRIFHYLDRYYLYLKKLASHPFMIWLVYGEMNDQVIEAVSSMIALERKEEKIDQDLVNNVLAIYVEIGSGSLKYYTKDFEEALLKHYTVIYSQGSSNGIASSSKDYMVKVHDYLKYERDIVLNHVHRSQKNLLEEAKQCSNLGMSLKKITLKCSDGEAFDVDEAVALQSKTIKHMIEENCADNSIPLPLVKSKILAKVIEYCKKHVEATDLEDQFSHYYMDWDSDFVKVDYTTLFDLLLAANYLNIKSLLDLAAQAVADIIQGKSPDFFREFFNIKSKNEFNSEENQDLCSPVD